MKVVFMGTPEFAVPTLESLAQAGHDISCVVTQPDKSRGRGNRVSFSPVKEKALQLNLNIMQPVRIKKDLDFIEDLRKMNPDVIVVVAFGQILPAEVLAIPRFGCINVHASLLPKLRGAAPINWAIINGEKQTGITTMLMDIGLDTGDMLLRKSIDIGDDETAGELHDRLKILGAKVLVETFYAIENYTLNRVPQDSTISTYAPMLNKDTGRINWEGSSRSIKNLVRGTNPWPASYTLLNNERLKVWSVDIEDRNIDKKRTGEVWNVDKQGIHICTGDGGVIIKEVQSDNGKRMDAYSYTLGHPINIGCQLK